MEVSHDDFADCVDTATLVNEAGEPFEDSHDDSAATPSATLANEVEDEILLMETFSSVGELTNWLVIINV